MSNDQMIVTLTVAELEQLVERASARVVEQIRTQTEAEVMTLKQCAEFLQRNPKTVIQLVERDGLPAQRISNTELRFMRSKVLNWLEGRKANDGDREAKAS